MCSMEMIADRSACLSRRPLWFRPMANPYMVIPLIMPNNETHLAIRSMEPKNQELIDEGAPPQPHWKEVNIFPGQTELVHTIAMEIGLGREGGIDEEELMPCGKTTREDVLFAFMF